MSRPRIVFLRSTLPHTTAGYYHKAMSELDVDVVDVPFNPHEDQTGLKLPDDADLLLLVDTGLPVEFPAMEKVGYPKGYVSIDSCHKLAIHKAYCEKYAFDHIWVAQKHVVHELGPRAVWLPLGVDPETYVYRPDEPAEKDGGLLARLFSKERYDIGMCAAPYKHRRRFEKIMKKAGLSTNFHFRKKFGRDTVREIARCTIGLNVGAGFTGERGKDINMRVFETMANGCAALLTNVYDGLGYEELFEDGTHYLTFRTEKEAVEKALYYSKHPDEARGIAEEGQRHVLANHTYRHRCVELLSVLG